VNKHSELSCAECIEICPLGGLWGNYQANFQPVSRTCTSQ